MRLGKQAVADSGAAEHVPLGDFVGLLFGLGHVDLLLGKMSIYWTANDPHLVNRPITILYAKTREGPWTELPEAKQIENNPPFTTNQCHALPYELFLKVEARDEAGNVGSAVSPESVKIDLVLPTVKELNVEVAPAP